MCAAQKKKEAEALVKQEEVTQMAYEKANKIMETSRSRSAEIKKWQTPMRKKC